MSEPLLSPTLQTLMEEFARSGVRELHLRCGDFEIYLSSDPAASRPTVGSRVSAVPPIAAIRPATPPPAAVSPPAAVASAAPLPADAVIIRAPNLGTFYRAPKPGAANYVEVGSQVAAGDEICLIEVMKLFTAVRADEGGKVHAVLAADGAMVEAGQPLFALVKD
jgi:acetyl-CoA carboxylase biotin carboxyl carrier protein